jgi:hypothetical protein
MNITPLPHAGYQIIPKAGKSIAGHKLDFHRFDSLSDFLDTVEARPAFRPEGYSQGKASLDLASENTKFLGNPEADGETFEDTIKIARSGWDRGREAVEEFARDIYSSMGDRILAPMPVYDVVGIDVDMGVYLTGDPECMIDYQPGVSDGKGKVITLAAQLGTGAGISADTIFIRGAMIGGLVDCLEHAGFSVDLWACHTCWQVMETQVKIKTAGEPLDLDALAFALAHPGMLRRCDFALREMQPAEDRKKMGVGRGYGPSNAGDPNIESHVRIPTNNELDKEIHYMGPAKAKAYAEKWILDSLKAQGIEVD